MELFLARINTIYAHMYSQTYAILAFMFSLLSDRSLLRLEAQ